MHSLIKHSSVTLLLLLIAQVARAASPAISFRPEIIIQNNDQAILEHFVTHSIEKVKGVTFDEVKKQCLEAPEMFAWKYFPYLDALLISYDLTGDKQILDLFLKNFAFYEKLLSTGTDDFLGWYGKPIPPRILKDQPDLLIDELQMNFRVIALLSEWIRQARSDKTYATEHAAEIKRFIELMEKHLYPKWDARGHYIDLGKEGGTYKGLDFPIQIFITLSHEKLSMMVDGLLKLHFITKNDRYLKRTIKLGTWLKTRLLLVDGHYEWMSWEPSGEWDKHPEKENKWKTGWMAPDPRAGWYAAGVSMSGMRRPERHWRVIELNSFSAMFSQLPCFGV